MDQEDAHATDLGVRIRFPEPPESVERGTSASDPFSFRVGHNEREGPPPDEAAPPGAFELEMVEFCLPVVCGREHHGIPPWDPIRRLDRGSEDHPAPAMMIDCISR